MEKESELFGSEPRLVKNNLSLYHTTNLVSKGCQNSKPNMPMENKTFLIVDSYWIRLIGDDHTEPGRSLNFCEFWLPLSCLISSMASCFLVKLQLIFPPPQNENFTSSDQHNSSLLLPIINFTCSTMTLTTIIQAAISSSKTVIPKTIQHSSSTIALPLSSMAVAYASSLSSKPLIQDHRREQELPKRMFDERLVADSNTKRFYHDSFAHRPHQRMPVVIEPSSDRIIDPFLGNLLDGFCNGSCYKAGPR